MPRFAANLSMLYPQHDFLERFSAAKADGFDAVEYLFPYEYDAQVLKQRLLQIGVGQWKLFEADKMQPSGAGCIVLQVLAKRLPDGQKV